MSLTLTIVRHGDTFAPGEPPRRIGAATDLPLVASGEAQARSLGRHFAGEGFDRVLVSPLQRTRQTAALILGRTAIPIPPPQGEGDHPKGGGGVAPVAPGVPFPRSSSPSPCCAWSPSPCGGGICDDAAREGRSGLTRIAHPAIETAPWLAEIDHGPDENATEVRVIARIGAAALARWNDALVAPPGWTVDADARIVAWRTLLAGAGGHVLLVTSAGAARFALAADAGLAEQAAALPSRKLRTGAWGRIVVVDGKPRIAAWDRRPDTVHAD